MKKLLTLLSLIIIIYACASVSSPTGGEKDKVHPELLSSTPKDQSINFNSKEITLTFSEWIKVSDLQKELIITPRIKNPFEYKQRKETITITFDENFPDSTTFTLNFRKGIEDITEGNEWIDSKIAFSTGNYLDSINIEGTITDLLTNRSEKQILVGLYDSKTDTANLRQGEPLYFTTSDEKGNYRISNVKADKYLLYAFHDKNDDLMNQSKTESFGYYTDTLVLTDTDTLIDLKIYHENQDTLQLKKQTSSGKDYVIGYNKGISEYKINQLEKDSTQDFIYSSLEDNNKLIRIFKENFSISEDDSIGLIITATDSLSNSLTDTVYAKYRESKIKNENIKIIKKPVTDITSGENEFQFRFNKPIYSINYDSLFISINDTMYLPITEKDVQLVNKKLDLTVKVNLNESSVNQYIENYKSYYDSIRTVNIDTTLNEENNSLASNTSANLNLKPYLYLGKGALVGIESDSIKKEKLSITFKHSDNYGIIKGNITGNVNSFIIQLVNTKFEVVDTLYNQNEFVFKYVKPGEYLLRIIEDANNNKKWDGGNPLKLTKAERVIIHPEKLVVKANWELIDKNIDMTDQTLDDSQVNNSENNVDNVENESE